MSNIASVYEYLNVFNQTTATTAEKTSIETFLTYSTALIEKYCDRLFTKTTYSEWINQPYPSEKNFIYTNQYPINKIYFIGVPVQCATIEDSNVASIIGTLSYDSNVFSRFTTKDDGNDETIEILASGYKTLATLKTQFETDANVICDVNTEYINYPTSYIKPFDSQDITGGYQAQLEVVKSSGLVAKVDIVDENCIKLNEGVDDIFVKYSAGYTATVDNADHTAIVTQGTMPKELVYVCSQVANDMISFAVSGSISDNAGISSNLISAEHIADYSYQKFPDATRDQIITKYTELLDRWTKKTFIS